jgi:hypothetical protein
MTFFIKNSPKNAVFGPNRHMVEHFLPENPVLTKNEPRYVRVVAKPLLTTHIYSVGAWKVKTHFKNPKPRLMKIGFWAILAAHACFEPRSEKGFRTYCDKKQSTWSRQSLEAYIYMVWTPGESKLMSKLKNRCGQKSVF